jgi:N-acetyl-anhydromuramyl-L-alanine amidase AmpD
MKKLLSLLFVALLFVSCRNEGPRIVDKPIDFSPERVRLTKEYIHQHYGLDVKDIKITLKIIVLHWIETNDLDSAFQILKPDTIQYGGIVAGAGKLNVSAHFLVDRDGTVYRLMPETWMARHVIGLNYYSIGVENVGGAGGVDNMTPAQVEANIRLVRYLVKKYPGIRYLIGHYEFTLMEHTPLWLEKDSSYRTVKTDPSPAFMQAVRKGVSNLHLEGPPH